MRRAFPHLARRTMTRRKPLLAAHYAARASANPGNPVKPDPPAMGSTPFPGAVTSPTRHGSLRAPCQQNRGGSGDGGGGAVAPLEVRRDGLEDPTAHTEVGENAQPGRSPRRPARSDAPADGRGDPCRRLGGLPDRRSAPPSRLGLARSGRQAVALHAAAMDCSGARCFRNSRRRSRTNSAATGRTSRGGGGDG